MPLNRLSCLWAMCHAGEHVHKCQTNNVFASVLRRHRNVACNVIKRSNKTAEWVKMGEQYFNISHTSTVNTIILLAQVCAYVFVYVYTKLHTVCSVFGFYQPLQFNRTQRIIHMCTVCSTKIGYDACSDAPI